MRIEIPIPALGLLFVPSIEGAIDMFSRVATMVDTLVSAVIFVARAIDIDVFAGSNANNIWAATMALLKFILLLTSL